MELIRNFGTLRKTDAAIAGGKGASLGEMTQAGIPVPPGFVLLAGAFERFLQEADLAQELDAILDQDVNRQEMRTVELASEKIKHLILSAKMPEDIAQEILSNFNTLDAEFVAVRSSATAEDSSSAAWAGQLESYLNTTEETLLENVQKCWASLYTPRAIFYRFEKGMHGDKISVAVVIQKMIQSEVSGIAFSVHPVTEDYNQMIIEAGFGLGEAIVSGQVTPDSYVVEKTPRRIIDKNITYQSKALMRAKDGGNEWIELSQAEGNKPALSDEQTMELAEIVLRIEDHYRFPCDIEWAFEAGNFYITQSRPITTLSVKKTDQRGYFFNTSYIKMGRWGTTPLDVETWHQAPSAKYFQEMHGIAKENLAVIVLDKEPYTYIYIPKPFMQRLYAYVDELTKKDPQALQKKLETFYADKKRAKEMLDGAHRDSYENLDTATLVDCYLKNRDVAHWITVCDQFTWFIEDRWTPLMENILAEKLKLEKGSAEYNNVLFTLIKPREISTTLEEKRDSIGSAIAIAKKENTIEESAKNLSNAFGWMPVLAYGKPWDQVWYERELHELLERDLSSLEKEYRTLKDYSRIRDEEVKAVVKKYRIAPEDLQVFVDFGLLVDTRNEAEYVVSYAGGYLMPMYEEISRRLSISISELRLFFEHEVVACLKGEYKAADILAEKKGVIAWGIESDACTRFDYSGSDAEDLLAYAESHHTMVGEGSSGSANLGVSASPGKARGVARLITTPDECDRVQQGEILVTFATMADFLPAMKRASAIVTEVGGLTCHAAVVSREFGIPCVVGRKNAMSDFKDGDMIEVDADSGIVRKI